MTDRKTERKTGPPGFTGRGLINNNSILISFGEKIAWGTIFTKCNYSFIRIIQI